MTAVSSSRANALPAPTHKRRRAGWLLVIPALVVVVLFFVLPLLDILVRTFTDVSTADAGGNYLWLVQTRDNIVIGLRTIVTSLVVTLICLVLAYPYAYLMTIVSSRTRSLLTIAVMMPLWTSILVRTLAWMILLQDTGPINALLEVTGIGAQSLIRTTFGVGIGMTQVLLPFMVLPLYSAMERIDRRLLPASASLGASGFTTFTHVYLPLSRPGIFSGCVSVFILGLGFYIIPSLLGSPKEAMISSLIYLQVSQFLQWGHGATLGVALLIVAGVILILFNRLTRIKKTSRAEGQQ